MGDIEVFMKRIIVSGAGGFLGRNIVKQALAENVPVVAITGRPVEDPAVTVVKTEDFIDHGFSCNSEDVFINCLFPTDGDGYKMAEGLRILYKVIEKAYESGVGAFINISSQSVYDPERVDPAREEDALCLKSPYAVGKYSSEAFVNRVFSDRSHSNIRMASLLGVGYDIRIVNKMAAFALKGNPLKVVGGMQRFGYLDVRDAAAGLMKMAQTDPSQWKEVYNLGKKESYSLLEIAQCVVDAVKAHAGMEASYIVEDGQDMRNSSIDPSLFMGDFDWMPEISLADTTLAIINDKLGEK